jgi:superfamily II DNA or RNA helicase
MSYTSPKKLNKISTKKLSHMSPNVCGTKFVGIKKIETCGEQNVYDITVKNNHCFFANNILVHNCQHWAAETCQIIADHSYNARFRYGLSATPFRDLGDDLLIDACFGKLLLI